MWYHSHNDAKPVSYYHSVWKSQKKSHSTLRAKRATFTFWLDKSSLKNAKNGQLATFWKSENSCQTVLPDNFDRTKWVENARLQKLKCDILVFFKHHEKCKCIKWDNFKVFLPTVHDDRLYDRIGFLIVIIMVLQTRGIKLDQWTVKTLNVLSLIEWKCKM